ESVVDRNQVIADRFSFRFLGVFGAAQIGVGRYSAARASQLNSIARITRLAVALGFDEDQWMLTVHVNRLAQPWTVLARAISQKTIVRQSLDEFHLGLLKVIASLFSCDQAAFQVVFMGERDFVREAGWVLAGAPHAFADQDFEQSRGRCGCVPF